MGRLGSRKKTVVVVSSDEDDTSAERNDAVVSDSRKEDALATTRKRGQSHTLQNAGESRLQTTTSPSTSEARDDRAAAGASKAKGKKKRGDSSATLAKPNTLYSFFNAATQRQKQSEPLRVLEKHTEHTEAKEDDIIQDASSDIETSKTALAKASSFALAVRKRKLRGQDGDGTHLEADVLPASQKYRKTLDGTRKPSLATAAEQDQRPWTDKYGPVDLSELAVHKKKVTDVRQWIETALSGTSRQRLLVLRGTAGTGKTATISLLAKEMDFDIVEWKNPTGSDYASAYFTSASVQFEEFMSRSGRLNALSLVTGDELTTNKSSKTDFDEVKPSTNRRQVILVEDFPNTFTQSSTTLQTFRSTVLQCLANAAHARREVSQSIMPIVMIISETLLSSSTTSAESFTVHRLLGPNILNHQAVHTIEYNPIAPTILSKALGLVILKEAHKSGRRTMPGSQVIKRLAESGDVRSATSSLEFLCLRGDEGDTWSSKVAITKAKKVVKDPAMTRAEQESLALISNRESSLGIFHAVGKVVYNKRLDDSAIADPLPQPPNHLPQHHRTKPSEVDINALLNELGTDTSTFISALHENYLLSCASETQEDTLDSLDGCLGGLSDADLLSLDRINVGNRAFSGSATDNLRQDEMSFQVCIRGMLFHLPNPVKRDTPAGGRKRDTHQMFYPMSIKLWRRREEIEGYIDLLVAAAQRGTLNSLGKGAAASERGQSGVVESWKTKNAPSSVPSPKVTTSDDQEASTVIVTIASGASARTETLLERLPYLAQIVRARVQRRQVPTINSSLTTPLKLTTSFSGIGVSANEEDDSDLPEDNAITDLTIDRTDNDHVGRSFRPKHAKGRNIQTEGGGLGIPVETAIDRLVLSDDDIEDD
ncbi:RFC checkpoint protein Rad17 [Elasticomyces elasticus]|nr:RFC checkpoint protein Rad17 [Elasticomyces elasticus]